MALTLGVKVGSVLYIEDTPVTVDSIKENEVVLSCEGVKTTIKNDVFSTVLPDVNMTVERIGWESQNQTQYEMARIVIDAPRSIKILRAELYDRPDDKKAISGTYKGTSTG